MNTKTHNLFGIGVAATLGLGTAVSSASIVNNGTFDSGVVTGLYNTGTDNSGTALSNLSAVPYYSLVSAPSNQGTLLNVYSSSGGYPGQYWVPPGSDSAWIAPAAGQAYSNSPQTYGLPGTYVYQTTFNSSKAGTITISGNWATDNSSNSMEINSDGLTSIVPTSGFGAFSTFAITGKVIAGNNTLDFFVTKLPFIADHVAPAVPPRPPVSIVGAEPFNPPVRLKLSW